MDSKVNGSMVLIGDVKEFISKVELYSAVTGNSEGKCAQNLASRLEGPIFDVFCD